MQFLAHRQKLQWKFWTQKEVFFWSSSWNQERSRRGSCWLSTASVFDNAFTSEMLNFLSRKRPQLWWRPFILASASCSFLPAKNDQFRKATSQHGGWLFFLHVCSHQVGKRCWWESIGNYFPPEVVGLQLSSSVKESSECLKSEPPLESDQERSKRGRNGRKIHENDVAGLVIQEQLENINERPWVAEPKRSWVVYAKEQPVKDQPKSLVV